jgi:hypothetical protein
MVMKIKIPDGSITRAKLETPSADVHLGWYVTIGEAVLVHSEGARYISALCIPYVFTDKAIKGVAATGFDDDDRNSYYFARIGDSRNSYYVRLAAAASTADHRLLRIVAGTTTSLGREAIDLLERALYTYMLSASGSVINSFRTDLTTPRISVTDTSLASGYFGVKPYVEGAGGGAQPTGLHELFITTSPASPAPPALAVLEVEVEGSGAPEDPYGPSLSKNLVEIQSLQGLPSFLYQEAKKYEILKNKGFTDEEMRILLGYIPQHQVDLASVTWGAFEFNKDSPTNIIIITGDNPHMSGAISKHIELARSKNLRVLDLPKNYGEAVAQFNKLKRDYPHWLAGKDNYAYQTLGLEELDLFQNVDFYYGELIEHKTHYQQLKQTPEWELWRRLEALEKRLEKVEVLAEERDKHIEKLRSVKRLGW